MTGRIRASYTRIGGLLRYQPPTVACVQTDGSYRQRIPKARIAAILLTADRGHLRRCMTPIDAHSSTETEWASVAMGLQLALEYNQATIGLENDNLSVIRGLIMSERPLRHEYASHYRNEIQELAKYTEWTGVRWIPREANHADGLFR